MVPEDQKAALRRELEAECAAGHPLFRQQADAVARSGGCDDVIFRVADRWALVHLTWTRRPEPAPLPTTLFVDSWSEAIDAARSRSH